MRRILRLTRLKPFITSQKILFIIAIFAFTLRVYNLSNVPAGFFCDEASTGYDAYCLLKTGCDQYGNFMPVFARSFGDYNEALYRYLTIPCIAVFGLNEFATRLTAVIFGTLTVVVLFYLCKMFFNPSIALLSSFLLAISPWHLMFSRIAFRAVLLPFFICLGLYFFLKSFDKIKYLYFSAVLMGISLYTYSLVRVFIPLFLIGLVIIYFKEIRREPKHFVGSALIFLLLSIPLGIFCISPHGMARINVTFIPSFKSFWHNYWTYFHPKFLFFQGDPNYRHSAPGIGQLLKFEMLTIPFGLVYWLKNFSKTKILFLWIIIYPIGAAMTCSDHALRGILGSIIYAILSACGLYFSVYLAKKSKVAFVVIIILAALISINTVTYLNAYYNKFPIESMNQWQFGYKDAINFSENGSYDHVIISDWFHIPHIFILFYTKYPPDLYQKSPLEKVDQDKWGYTDYALKKYQIDNVRKMNHFERNTLLIVLPVEVEHIKSTNPDYYVDIVGIIYEGQKVPAMILLNVNPR